MVVIGNLAVFGGFVQPGLLRVVFRVTVGAGAVHGYGVMAAQ